MLATSPGTGTLPEQPRAALGPGASPLPAQIADDRPEKVSGRPLGLEVTASCYWTALIMSKIGRYMATIIPPTITPRKMIITGSIADSSTSTAASTSSS